MKMDLDGDNEALANADVNAATIEASDEPVAPSVKWVTTPRRDGTHDATLSIRLRDGRELRPTVHARTRRSALMRVAQLARRALDSPEVQAVLPPQAHAAVMALHVLSSLARKGRLAGALRVMRSRAMKRVARALL